MRAPVDSLERLLGRVEAELEGVHEALGDLRSDIRELRRRFEQHREQTVPWTWVAEHEKRARERDEHIEELRRREAGERSVGHLGVVIFQALVAPVIVAVLLIVFGRL